MPPKRRSSSKSRSSSNSRSRSSLQSRSLVPSMSARQSSSRGNDHCGSCDDDDYEFAAYNNYLQKSSSSSSHSHTTGSYTTGGYTTGGYTTGGYTTGGVKKDASKIDKPSNVKDSSNPRTNTPKTNDFELVDVGKQDDEEEEDIAIEVLMGGDDIQSSDSEGSYEPSISGGGALKRFTVTSKNITLKIDPCRMTGSACVLVSLKLVVNPVVLRLLKGGGTGSFKGDDVDTTIVAFNTANKIKKDLFSNPRISALSKATSVNFGCTNKEFQISVVCDRSLTSAKKCVAFIVKNLQFICSYQTYRQTCMLLDIAADKDGYEYGLSQCRDSLNDGINIIVSGKVRVADKVVAERAVDSMQNKIKKPQKCAKGKKRVVDHVISSPHINVLSASIGDSLLNILVKQVVDKYCNFVTLSSPEIYVLERDIDKLRDIGSNSSYISAHVDKMIRLDDELPSMLVYLACIECGVSFDKMKATEDYKPASISSYISSALKKI